MIIDAGTKQGMVPGRRLQAYRPAKEVRDPLTHNTLMVPDDVIGDLFVVKAGESTLGRPRDPRTSATSTSGTASGPRGSVSTQEAPRHAEA